MEGAKGLAIIHSISERENHALNPRSLCVASCSSVDDAFLTTTLPCVTLKRHSKPFLGEKAQILDPTEQAAKLAEILERLENRMEAVGDILNDLRVRALKVSWQSRVSFLAG